MDFSFLSAGELADGLRAGRWTSVELTRFFLDRIATHDETHAVPFSFAREALEQAAASDARAAKLGPLDGVPMTLKDSLRVRGLYSTYGIFAFRRTRPKRDSALAEALRAEGIVFLGRTAVPTGAFDWNTRNQVYRECVNPFDHARTPGGSSGGAAAALATGLTPLELGSDLGGSIRYPAHCCGVYGLRPTDGLYPINDIGPEGVGEAFLHLATPGPMARSVADVRRLHDIFKRRLNLKAPAKGCGSNTIAVTREMLGVSLESESAKLFDSYLSTLRARGFKIEETLSPVEAHDLYRLWGIIAGFEYQNAVPRLFRRPLAWWILERRLGRGKFATYFRQGFFASRTEYELALKERAEVFAAFEKFFDRYDAWLLPVARGPAFLLEDSGRSITSEGKTFDYADYVGAFTVPTVAPGTPALAVPIGRTASGLPIGVQFHARRFADEWLLDFAERLVL